MTVKESGEMYLETILRLQKTGISVHSIDVAKALNFTKPSVSRSIKILQENGYITLDSHKAISLTESGLAIANTILERHEILTKYLIHLGVSPEVAETDACRIEHVISHETFGKIVEEFKRLS